jgi:hypothetical protein
LLGWRRKILCQRFTNQRDVIADWQCDALLGMRRRHQQQPNDQTDRAPQHTEHPSPNLRANMRRPPSPANPAAMIGEA